MTPSLSLSGLESVAAGEESPRRDAILSALTSQYVELEPRLSDRHIELYDNVFRVLVSGIELQARLALAERLAPMKRAPREIIRDLANDPYAIVATPVLQRSPVLEEDDLVTVARTCSEAHRAALAQRPELNTTITDVLVDRREQSVLVALIGNDSARLSPDGATKLTEVAAGNMVVAQALAVRLQLPATAVTQILHAARTVVVATLAQASPEARASDITAAVGEAVGMVQSLPRAFDGPLTEQQVVTLYGMKSCGEVAEGLGQLAGIGADLVAQALESPSLDGLLIVLKAARFSTTNAEAMLAAKLSLPLGARALLEPLRQFERINAVDPARMLGFVLSRDTGAIIH
jgi:hypothetical protein